MNSDIDNSVFELAALIQNGASQGEVDVFLGNVIPEHRKQIEQLARAKADKFAAVKDGTIAEVIDELSPPGGPDDVELLKKPGGIV